MQLYLPPAALAPCRCMTLWIPPWALKSGENCSCALTVRPGARESVPKGEKAPLWGPKGAKSGQNDAEKDPKWRQN